MMADDPLPLNRTELLLEKINIKLGWAIGLLAVIMVNTCSLGDDLSDAARDLRKSGRSATAQPQG